MRITNYNINMAVLYTQTEIINVEPKNGSTFTCEELQKYVGGLFEFVWLKNNIIMVCNEEGLLEHLPLNPRALDYAWKLGYGYNYVVGNVLFIKDNEVE